MRSSKWWVPPTTCSPACWSGTCGRRGTALLRRRPGLDSPFRGSPFRHRQLRRGDVAVDLRRRVQLDALGRAHAAGHAPADRDGLGAEIGLDVGALPDRQAVVAELDGSLDAAVDGEIFAADDAPLDAKGLADPGSDAALGGGGICHAMGVSADNSQSPTTNFQASPLGRW